MSDVSTNIVVQPNNINVVVGASPILVTPTATSLNIFSGGVALPNGNIGELQYNNGILAGIPNVTYISGNLNLGNVANVKIVGGSNTYVLRTDGTGNLSWAPGGGVGFSSNAEILFNNAGNVDGISNTIVSSGTLTFTNLANLKINGGTNGYVLQTDGAGNLGWTTQTGGGGNGSPGGSNTQIQYNDGGLFGGTSGFTFDKIFGNMAVPATISGTQLISNIANGTAPLIVTSTTQVANLNVATAGSATTANSATTAGTVTTNAQPNITSVGTLTGLTVAGMTSIQEAKEKLTANSTASTGTLTFDVLTQAILYKSANATANFTLNIRGNSTTSLNSIMSNNESLTITFINTNGANAYYANVIQIDASNITPVYPLAVTPNAGTSNGKDVYTYNIFKLASNTYTVFGSRIGFS
jgi:hypothetical protein